MLMIVFSFRYLLLQGLSGAAAGFLQIVSLIVYYVKLFLLGSTPRSIWGIKYGKSGVAWGTLFPNITLLVVISMSLSIEQMKPELIFLRSFCSSWLLHHRTYHKRIHMCHFLLVLSTVQVSFLVCIPTTHYNGYRRIILPQGVPACTYGIVCAADLSLCFILFGDGQQWSS